MNIGTGGTRPVTWLDAIRGIPRMSALEWQATGPVARWLIVSRAPVLVMTLAAVLLGAVLAVGGQPGAGERPLLILGLCLVGALLGHAANNQLNDYTDSVRGVDSGNYFRRQYGVHALEDGYLDRRSYLLCFALTGTAALAAGVGVLLIAGPAVLAPFLLGGFFLLFYTHPLKRLGLGEAAVLAVWGPLLVGGTHAALTGAWPWEVLLIGTAYGLAPTAVVLGKHIDKIDFDRGKGVRTLPVRLGERRSRRLVVVLTVAQHLVLGSLVAGGAIHWAGILTLLALPSARRLVAVFAKPAPESRPRGYPEAVWPLWFSALAFDHARRFGLLLLAGLGAGALIG